MGFKKTLLTKDYEDQLRRLGEIDVSGKKMTGSKVKKLTQLPTSVCTREWPDFKQIYT